MKIINAKVYGEDFRFHNGEIEIENGKISRVRPVSGLMDRIGSDILVDGDTIDAQGCYVIPGLIDLHFHGALGYDVCDGTEEAFEKIAQYELSQGVTSICPATLTLPEETLVQALSVGKEFAARQAADDASALGAELIGFNMEGPFISPVKKGAQNEAYIRGADAAMAAHFLEAAGGLVKIIGLAPEENENFADYIQAVRDRVVVSLAHTNADYETAAAAIKAGADHAVHLYNAMPELTHKEPGVVGAVFDSKHVTAELICDGIHVHPAAVRTAFSVLGEERMILISDSLRSTGMEDGVYDLGGQGVEKQGPYCTVRASGALAGSVSNLYDCMTNVVRTMGLSLETAVRCATANPAKRLSVFDRLGSLTAGKQADLVILNHELTRQAVVKRGVLVPAFIR